MDSNLIFISVIVLGVFLVLLMIVSKNQKEGYIVRPYRRFWRRRRPIIVVEPVLPFEGFIDEWQRIGIAYVIGSCNPDHVDVQKLGISAFTNESIYRIINRFGQMLPFKLPPGLTKLENGDHFFVSGMGEFIFNACDPKYL